MLDSTHAAQAILDEAYHLPLQNGQPNMAAALEALADQVVPEVSEPRRGLNVEPEKDVVFIGAWHIWNANRCARREILAIAAQLRGSSQATPPDNRNPDCVAAWPGCHDGGYDQRCHPRPGRNHQ